MPFPRPVRPLICNLLATAAALVPVPTASACTRAVYLGKADIVVTARTMDWVTGTETNLWALPRGLQRDGAAGRGSFRWTSRFGSLVATAHDRFTVDGMNEQGLVASLLYLAESKFPKPHLGDPRKPMSTSIWAQCLLDRSATVAEAVAAMNQEPFYLVPATAPNGMLSTTHLAISDASGDSAIFESIEGRLVIHHGRQFQVMTNSPAYDQQLALNDYWRQMGGTVMMPGTSRSADRFVRASFYLNAVQRTADASEAVACAFSVIRSVSTPLGFPTPAQPNLAPTHWRSVSDHKNRRYYFESARGLDLFWVDLADLDFKAAAPARRLDLMHGAVYAGNAAARFQPAEPFPFQSAGNGPPLLGSPDQTALPSPRQGAGSVAAWGVFASGIAGR